MSLGNDVLHGFWVTWAADPPGRRLAAINDVEILVERYFRIEQFAGKAEANRHVGLLEVNYGVSSTCPVIAETNRRLRFVMLEVSCARRIAMRRRL